MKTEEKQLFKSLCNFKTEIYDGLAMNGSGRIIKQ